VKERVGGGGQQISWHKPRESGSRSRGLRGAPFDAVFDTSCPGNERCAVFYFYFTAVLACHAKEAKQMHIQKDLGLVARKPSFISLWPLGVNSEHPLAITFESLDSGRHVRLSETHRKTTGLCNSWVNSPTIPRPRPPKCTLFILLRLSEATSQGYSTCFIPAACWMATRPVAQRVLAFTPTCMTAILFNGDC